MTDNIVLATSNKGKLAELSQLLAPLQLSIVPQSELGVTDADETGLSFIENAILKARHAALVTGLPAIADDSGLAVDALGGAPGIYSARYAGEAASDSSNIDKLLQALKDVPPGQRSAQQRRLQDRAKAEQRADHRMGNPHAEERAALHPPGAQGRRPGQRPEQHRQADCQQALRRAAEQPHPAAHAQQPGQQSRQRAGKGQGACAGRWR